MKEMTVPIDASLVDKASGGKKNRLLFMFAPFVVTLLLLLVPVPEGPLAAPKFKLAAESFKWAVSGFGNSTVWLIFGAFMFAAGYDKTQCGRRLALILVKHLGRRSLTLGYAITFADLLLAPFTPSNTARSGGTIFPIIANLPPLYGSKPNDPSARKIGSYLMWVAITAACITSSMFLSALAPNLLALALVKSTVGINISWGNWFVGFLPVGILLILTMPLLAYIFYPPEVKFNDEVPRWASAELVKLGRLTRNESNCSARWY